MLATGTVSMWEFKRRPPEVDPPLACTTAIRFSRPSTTACRSQSICASSQQGFETINRGALRSFARVRAHRVDAWNRDEILEGVEGVHRMRVFHITKASFLLKAGRC